MKNLAIVLASGVVAGLAAYAIIEWQYLADIGPTGLVMMKIAVFVGSLAGVGFGSAALALLFRKAFQRADDALIRRLESRIARLEERSSADLGRGDLPPEFLDQQG